MRLAEDSGALSKCSACLTFANGHSREIYAVPKLAWLYRGFMTANGINLRTLVVLLAAASLSVYAQTSVPYIGCPGDGQTGPYLAAKGSPKPVNLSLEMANKLAWYEYKGDAGQIGTLGPRGWNCFVTIGSNGETLYVAPEALDSAKVLEHKNWKGFTGGGHTALRLGRRHIRPLRSGADGGSCISDISRLRPQDHRRGLWPRLRLSFRSFPIRPSRIQR